jgi:hypothetical protein
LEKDFHDKMSDYVRFEDFTAVTRMPSSEMLRCVPLVRTDILEELSTSIIRVKRIGKLRTTLAVTSNRSVRRLLVMANVVRSSPTVVTLMMETLSFSETSVLTVATWPNISEDGILQNMGRFEGFKV